MKLYRNKEGKKLYPVCKWDNNQHKLYNAHDRAMINLYDTNYSTEAFEAVERIERAIEAFERHVIDGMVYATYQDGLLIKNYIWAYNARH